MPCPKCGKSLVEKRNRDTGGHFLACTGYPDCRYTTRLRRELGLYCDLCGGTGKIPLKRKNGSVVPGAFVYCECKVEADRKANDHFQSFNPDNIDFPVSWAFRRFYETEGGREDLGSLEIPIEDEPKIDTQRQPIKVAQVVSTVEKRGEVVDNKPKFREGF